MGTLLAFDTSNVPIMYKDTTHPYSTIIHTRL